MSPYQQLQADLEKKIGPKQAAFLAEYEKLCREHRMRVGTDDPNGPMLVVAYCRDLEATRGISGHVEGMKKREAWVV